VGPGSRQDCGSSQLSLRLLLRAFRASAQRIYQRPHGREQQICGVAIRMLQALSGFDTGKRRLHLLVRGYGEFLNREWR
jgi:hypothetical protein